jgi:UbiD family decarboxylase
MDRALTVSVKPPSLDLQAHLAELEAQGLLVRVDQPVNKDTELHPLVRCQFLGGIPEDERRAFLFTNVIDSHGRRYDIPVAVGAYAASPKIYAIGMGRPVAEIGADWLHAISNPIAPVMVTSPPCQEVVIKGDGLRLPGGGLASLPAPISTPGFDAAPYLTATLCITVDPDSGIRNIGTYRAALKKTDRLGVRMSSRIGGAGGYLHWCKYRDRSQRMPCAIVIGAAPVIAYTGAEKLAIDQDEMAVAGALAGVAIRTAKALTVDLEIPADAEIVIEGLIDTDMLEPEGPFGESNGYVALEDFNMSMEVTAITHRRSPVFVSIISQVSPSESSVIKKLALEPLFLNHLRDHLSLRSVLRVVMHEPLSNLRPIIFVQFANDTPKTEVWRGLQGASARQADCGKIVVAVSEDIDPDNTDAVMWSLAYRSNPIEDVHVEPYRSTGHAPKSGPAGVDSTLLIDATLKYPMARLALPGREFMERAQTLWKELGLPKLTVRAPWHGYSLGDWTDTWEAAAHNAVAGAWAKNGANTWERRRCGLTPETPARTVEAGEPAPTSADLGSYGRDHGP